MKQQFIKYTEPLEEINQQGSNFLQSTLNGYYGQKNMSSLLEMPKQVKRIDLKQYVSNQDRSDSERIILLEYDLDDYKIISSLDGKYCCVDIQHEKLVYFFDVLQEKLLIKFDYSDKNDNIDLYIAFTQDSKYALLNHSNEIYLIPFECDNDTSLTIWIEKGQEIQLITNNEKVLDYISQQFKYTRQFIEILSLDTSKTFNGGCIGKLDFYCNPSQNQRSLKIAQAYNLGRKNPFIMDCKQYLTLNIPPIPSRFIEQYENVNANFGGKNLNSYLKYFGVVNCDQKKIKLYNLFKGKMIKKINHGGKPYNFQNYNTRIFIAQNDLIIQLSYWDRSYYPKIRYSLHEIHCFKFQSKECDKIFEQLESKKARSEIRKGIVEFYSF